MRPRSRDYYFLDAQQDRLLPPTFDAERVRRDFPLLRQPMNGHRLVFLDNAATTQKPRAVIDGLRRYYERDNSNIHRAVHELAREATRQYEAARGSVARFIGAAANELVFVRGTTEAINLVAQSYLRPRLGPGDEVLVTEQEHHSNLVPWQQLCRERGALLRAARVLPDGRLDLDDFERQLTPRTRFAAFAQVSNALGTVNPVAELTALAHARGVPVLVDGAQGIPHLHVDVRALGCDFYAFSGHKLYAPTGIGALYGRAELLEEMQPYQSGGGMVDTVELDATTFLPAPHRFEAGTPDIAGAIGLGQAVEYLESLNWSAALEYEHEVAEYGRQKLAAVPGVQLVGGVGPRVSVISFNLAGRSMWQVGEYLDQQGIAVRAGKHCAQPLMNRLGIPGTVRAAVGLYNGHDDLDALVDALQALR